MGAFNVMELKLKHSKWVMRAHGLAPRMVELDNGSSIHCWVPLHWPPPPSLAQGGHGAAAAATDLLQLKPAVLLLHGFGMDGTICWEQQVPSLAKKFSLFIPDLLFFGKSTTTNKQRSELFQAECMFALMQKLGVVQVAHQTGKLLLCGHSYGGFVAYRMAHLYPDAVGRVVIMSSGISMDAMTDNLPLLRELGGSRIEEFLTPQCAPDFHKSLTLAFHKLPWLPSFVFKDIFEVLNSNRQERHELIDGMIIGSKNVKLPRVSQDMLIIWGEHDKVFNLNLAYSLQRFLGDNATLAIIGDVGHMPHMEKPKEVSLAITNFFAS